MAWRKKMAESKGASADSVGNASTGSVKPADMANSVDNMDFFGGAGGGGTLTPEGIRDAQRTRSKTIDAMDELQEAVKSTGSLPPDESAAELSRVIGNAYEAGVSVTSPPMKRAAALLTVLEAAADTGVLDQEKTEVVGPDAGLEDKLDALFGGFAPPPDLDL